MLPSTGIPPEKEPTKLARSVSGPNTTPAYRVPRQGMKPMSRDVTAGTSGEVNANWRRTGLRCIRPHWKDLQHPALTLRHHIRAKISACLPPKKHTDEPTPGPKHRNISHDVRVLAQQGRPKSGIERVPRKLKPAADRVKSKKPEHPANSNVSIIRGLVYDAGTS